MSRNQRECESSRTTRISSAIITRCDFVCDTLRMAITGGVEPFDMDQMMELDMEVHHHEASLPIGALSTMADALPGLGIVAAVLGVVITMGALGGPPEEIGNKVAAALVGTFLGILLCYGVAGPLASNMAKTADDHNSYLHVLRVLMLSFLKGSAPMIAIEMGRRAIPAHVRPSFDEMEKSCKNQAVDALRQTEAALRLGTESARIMAASKAQPIIVIKKKGGHGGHHGGAWKVAYADFVTAMMSLFIVLWLMNSSDKIKKAVAGYFNDPRGTSTLMGTTLTGTGETVTAAASDNLQKLKDKLEQEIKASKELEKLSKQIEITITPEGCGSS